MPDKKGLNAVPIYRLDLEAIRDYFQSDKLAIIDVPEKIIERYNRSKEALIFKLEAKTLYDDCHIIVYRNVTTRRRPSEWVKFYEPAGVEISDLRSENQQLIGFVIIGDELLAHTGGQASHVFETFVDLSFPISVARRVAEPEVKRARSSPITGAALASDISFRDPRRITRSESLENVWTALSGQVRSEVLADQSVVSIFGRKKKMKIDISGSIKLGPRVESVDKLLSLMRWALQTSEATLPTDDEWKILDSISLLSPRKSKNLIAALKKTLAERLFSEADTTNMALTHSNTSLYVNASTYKVQRGSEVLLETQQQPELSEVLSALGGGVTEGEALLTRSSIRSQVQDLGPGVETEGSLLDHLHGEIQHEGSTYFLLAGRWYKVDADYVSLVTEDLLVLLEQTDLNASELSLPPWNGRLSEGEYNTYAADTAGGINGDRVLTENVELFDTLLHVNGRTFIIHVKRGFDVKVRDVRSQVINSANLIENDIRSNNLERLRVHHAKLVSWGRTTKPEEEFLSLFRTNRTYVLAYGTQEKVTASTLDSYKSIVARMEAVTLSGQFRQIASGSQPTELKTVWLPITS